MRSQFQISATLLSFLIFLVVSNTLSVAFNDDIIDCLFIETEGLPIPIYTAGDASFTKILQYPTHNLRFLSPSNPKPNLIVTPLNEDDVQTVRFCADSYGFRVKIRSGGHDYEGLSIVSDEAPYLILDMFNLRSVDVDVNEKTAWVQSGATLGELYYAIAEKSKTLAFPGGLCATVGVGGHLSGGGYGTLLRKYGLAADQVIDARIVNVHGTTLDRTLMGEDLFWAIRGGSAGGSFGVILAWKVKLVSVPRTVTVFSVGRTLEEGATELVHKWQYVADKFPKELFMRIAFHLTNSSKTGEKTVTAFFDTLYLGGADELVSLLEQRFPELGIQQKDCKEMSWIQSALYFGVRPYNGLNPLHDLLSRDEDKSTYKAKSDYVKEPISITGLKGIWKRLLEEEKPVMVFVPYGGIMDEISESEIPFPHRKGNKFMIQYLVYWNEKGVTQGAAHHMKWIRNLYAYMEQYVSKNPRTAYINYRDIDLGRYMNGTGSYSQGEAWGRKYFNGNFDRLVKVKSIVDPENFFRNEQSIPTLSES
ncbi:berberine bridge enzyme-like 15 [Papaver somniferum]|uniref:berberine bridge enzyme-like 15 n=1 Tax=Papaver somniferum TaxID=3469 RepID=UPI000E6FC9F8|nr:berberine bridge enzyme-like 15 [Papaver somniferum]